MSRRSSGSQPPTPLVHLGLVVDAVALERFFLGDLQLFTRLYRCIAARYSLTYRLGAVQCSRYRPSSTQTQFDPLQQKQAGRSITTCQEWLRKKWEETKLFPFWTYWRLHENSGEEECRRMILYIWEFVKRIEWLISISVINADLLKSAVVTTLGQYILSSGSERCVQMHTGPSWHEQKTANYNSHRTNNWRLQTVTCGLLHCRISEFGEFQSHRTPCRCLS
jgi:hypothetical protein